MKNCISTLVVCFFFLFSQNSFSQTIPSLEWGVSFGGFSVDRAYAMTNDNANNVITLGTVQSTVDFDPGAGVDSQNGSYDIYLSKLNANGQYQWAKRFFCGISSYGTSIATDANNNIYITGSHNGGGDFDPGPGVSNYTTAGSFDFFVSKFNSNGDLVWVKNFGGAGYDQANGIAVDHFGHVLVTGRFASDSVDFDPSSSEYKLGPGTGGGDIFILSLDTAGNFNWAKSVGGNSTNPDIGFAITTDSIGNVYSTGQFFSTTDFDPGPGTFNLTATNSDIYVLKLDSVGDFKWAIKFGSSAAGELGRSIKTDHQGNVLLCGEFWSTVDFDPSAGVANLVASNGDAFIAKYDSLGNYVWAKNIGSSNQDYAYFIEVDAYDRVLTTGMFQNTCDFNPGSGVFNLTAGGLTDAYILFLESNGDFVWAGNIGSTSQNIGYTVSVDNLNQIYWAGVFLGTTDTDPSAATNTLTAVGNMDIFVSKFGLYAPLPVSIQSFYGTNCNSQACLFWSTSNEMNVREYEIERSTNAIEFERIGNQYAISSDRQLKEYDFTDKNPLSGSNYYRLKCVDHDGQYMYSNVVTLNFDNSYSIKIAPSYSTKGEYKIISDQMIMEYSIYNEVGRRVCQASKMSSFSLNQLPVGIYFINIKTKAGTTVIKILNQ